MNKFFKKINGEIVVKDQNQIVINKNGKNIFNPSKERLLQDGWLEYIVQAQTAELILHQKETSEAKLGLENSDYKIIKCMEAFLCGEELPYDIKLLHELRNNYRNKLN